MFLCKMFSIFLMFGTEKKKKKGKKAKSMKTITIASGKQAQ